MASKVEICNTAIISVGAPPVNAIPDPSGDKASEACDQLWEQCLKELLSEHPWKWALVHQQLAVDSGYTSVYTDDYDYAYQIPTALVRFSDSESSDTIFVRRGQHLLTNDDELAIEFVQFNEDTTKFPAKFTRALSALLAREIFFYMSTKGSFDKNFAAKYERALEEAKLEDYYFDRPSETDRLGHSTDTDSWVNAWG